MSKGLGSEPGDGIEHRCAREHRPEGHVADEDSRHPPRGLRPNADLAGPMTPERHVSLDRKLAAGSVLVAKMVEP
jgi:hypothetical protein